MRGDLLEYCTVTSMHTVEITDCDDSAINASRQVIYTSDELHSAIRIRSWEFVTEQLLSDRVLLSDLSIAIRFSYSVTSAGLLAAVSQFLFVGA